MTFSLAAEDRYVAVFRLAADVGVADADQRLEVEAGHEAGAHKADTKPIIGHDDAKYI